MGQSDVTKLMDTLSALYKELNNCQAELDKARRALNDALIKTMGLTPFNASLLTQNDVMAMVKCVSSLAGGDIKPEPTPFPAPSPVIKPLQ